MKRNRHTGEQIIRKLKPAEPLIAQGNTFVDVCRVIEVMQPTYHRWGHQYGGMLAEEARRLTQLEKENARLKMPLAEAALEKAMLKDLVAPRGAPPTSRAFLETLERQFIETHGSKKRRSDKGEPWKPDKERADQLMVVTFKAQQLCRRDGSVARGRG